MMKKMAVFFICLVLIFVFCSCVKKVDKAETETLNEIQTDIISEIDFFRIEGKEVFAESYNLQIPDNFIASKSGNSLKLEGEKDKQSLYITIEEHSYSNDNYEQYLSETIGEFQKAGALLSTPEAVIIGGIDMQRMKLTLLPMQSYVYSVDLGCKALLISVIANNEELSAEETDEMINRINLSTN